MQQKKLYRSTKDRQIMGVCGGIAEYFGVDSTVIRVGAIVLMLAAGSGLLAYILCALIMPENPNKYIEI